MAIHKIPIERLSPEAIRGVIEEFILREGTDYGEKETSMETKIHQVRIKLEKGLSVLVFEDVSETTNILNADDPVLKKLEVQE